MESGTREADLVRRAAAGDSVAAALLLKDSRDRLCRYLGRKVPGDLRGTMDAADIVQEAHVEVFRHLDRFESRGPDSFYRWVATIALRKLRAAIKQRRTAKRGGGRTPAAPARRDIDSSMIALLDDLAAPGRTPSRVVARAEALEAVKAALETLPERNREAIWGVHIEERPVADVAERMGVTDRAVHGLCRRGLKLLRERLGTASKFLSSSG